MPLTRLVGNVLKMMPLTPASLLGLQRRWQRHRARRLHAKYRDATMIPPSVFLDNLWLCRRLAAVDGCVIECGVWRGGMLAAMAEVLGPDRRYYGFDSFQGLPDAKLEQDGAWAVQRLATADQHPRGRAEADQADAEATLRRSGVPAMHLVKGWFADTLPGFLPSPPIAVLRVDADLYESTWQCLDALYPYVVPGGLILFDDYYSGWDGCPRAVHAYFALHQLAERIRQSPAGVAYVVKGSIEH
jgi:hypothetical protein